MLELSTHSLGRRLKIIGISMMFVLFFTWIFSVPFTILYLLTGLAIFSWSSLVVYYGFLVLFIYGMIWGGYRLRVRQLTLTLPKLPSTFDGLKIAQISDLHLGTFGNPRFIERAVRRILEEKPDIIFFTGDLVNNRAREALPFLEDLKKLSAPLGIFSILGNHDYGDYVSWKTHEAKAENLKQVEDTHRGLGWNILLNDHAVLTRGTDSVAIIGVQNWGHAHNFPKYGDLKKATDGLQNTPVKLLLSHDPSHFTHIVSKEWPDIDVTFSGHTHGGQFGIEIGDWKWSPVHYFYHRWAGLYTEGSQYLYVNRGLGMLAYSGRVGIWPEITVMTLKNNNSPTSSQTASS